MSIQSIQSIKDQMAAMEQSLSQLRRALDMLAPSAEPAKAEAKPAKAAKAEAKPAKAAKAEPKEPKEPRAPTAWNLLVQSTVADMKQSGWESWTDAKGVVWPGSRRESESFVYDGGEHDGKPPSPARGGMVRASYLKSSAAGAVAEAVAAPSASAASVKAEPKKAGRPKMTAEQKAEAAAKRAAKAESGSESASASGDKPKKAGRPKMTAEQKAAAAAKRAEKKAASASASDAESVQTCSAVPDGWAELLGEKVVTDQKVVADNKKVDLSFYPFKYEGKSLVMNDRGDVVDPEEGTWVGRLTNGILDKTFAEPADLEEVVMRE
jgi:hypothetical protein